MADLMSTPLTCWKCGNPLRTSDTAFCHTCGAALKPDAPTPNAANPWQTRLRMAENTSITWRLLWMLAGPLSVILFPFLLSSATRRLRRHLQSRLAAPAFATSRFKDALEGKQIIQQLAQSAGKLTGKALWPVAGAIALLSICLGVLFLAPVDAPPGIGYADGMEAVVGSRSYRSVSISSERDYEAFWSSLSANPGMHVTIWAYPNYNTPSAKGTNAPQWEETHKEETRASHRPYEYWSGPITYNSARPPISRVSWISVHYQYDWPATAIFWTGIGLLYLLYLVAGVQFWRRFARHATAETFAAAYARGDTGLLDKLLPGVKASNGATIFLGILLALTPLQCLLFPFAASVAFLVHEKWERRSGVADALGM